MRTACFLALFLVAGHAVPVPTGVSIDRWELDGHGNPRILFSGTGSDWSVTKLDLGGSTCDFPKYYTPFWGADEPAGANMNAEGVIHMTLLCSGKAHLLSLDASSGKQLRFEDANATQWDSYIRYLPDGSLVAGTNSDSVRIYDKDSLKQIGRNTGIIGGGGGAQVLAVTKTNPPQLTCAGGTGGPDWWGTACDVSDSTLINCKGNSDSTVDMAADGLHLYNNVRFGNSGVTKYTMPLPSNPVQISDDYVNWPWWIRSDLQGNTYVFDGTNLSKYSEAAKQLWSVSKPHVNGGGLFVTDDEKTVIISEETYAVTIDAKNGATLATLNFTSAGVDSCKYVDSPWTMPLPVPLKDSNSALYVCKEHGRDVVKVADLSVGKFGPSHKLATSPDQVLVDDNGVAYIIGRDTNKDIQVERVAL